MLALVALAGCGLGGDDDLPAPEPPTTAAASLRADLDALFREHVYLLGSVTENVITGQGVARDGASNALEENTLALADQFERTYAARGEKGFLGAWRPYTELMTQYAGRLARKQPLARADEIFGRIENGMGAFGAALTPLINARVLAGTMRKLTTTMRAAIDAQVAKDFVKAGSSLRAAGGSASDIGTTFARAFADDLPALYPGDPRSPSASFRIALAGPMVEHVFLVGMTTENILTSQSRPRDGAKAALDAATAALAKQIGSAYAVDKEQAFLSVWKRQGDLLISYANSAKDAAKREQIAEDLGQYATDAAGFLSGLDPGLKLSSLERIIGAHGQAMAQVIDAQAAGDFTLAGLRLRLAAQQIGSLGSAIAVATVERFPVRFRPTPAGF